MKKTNKIGIAIYLAFLFSLNVILSENRNPESEFQLNVNSAAENVLDDNFEDNDSVENASVLSPGNYSDLQAFDDDWYIIKIPAYSNVSIFIYVIVGDYNYYNINLYRQDLSNDLIQWNYDAEYYPKGNGGCNITTSTRDEEFTYVFEIAWNSQNISYVIEYNLSIDDEYEYFLTPDSIENAARLETGTIQSLKLNDDDYYYMSFKAIGRVKITVEYKNNTKGLLSILEDPDYNYYKGDEKVYFANESVSIDGNKQFSSTYIPMGDVNVDIYFIITHEISGEYDLFLEFEPASKIAGFELNFLLCSMTIGISLYMMIIKKKRKIQ